MSDEKCRPDFPEELMGALTDEEQQKVSFFESALEHSTAKRRYTAAEGFALRNGFREVMRHALELLRKLAESRRSLRKLQDRVADDELAHDVAGELGDCYDDEWSECVTRRNAICEYRAALTRKEPDDGE